MKHVLYRNRNKIQEYLKYYKRAKMLKFYSKKHLSQDQVRIHVEILFRLRDVVQADLRVDLKWTKLMLNKVFGSYFI